MSSKNIILEMHPWIDLDFVQALVNKSNYERNLTVESFHVEKAVNDGKNFCSNTVRLVVDIFQNVNVLRRVYFLKISLQTEDFVKAAEECFYYEKEIEVYNDIIPAAEELLESIKVPTQFAPKYGKTNKILKFCE